MPDPTSTEAGARLYRTGDVAKFREDGVLEFLGRADHQIKIRGHRIEPREVETALERIPGLARALAVARGEGVARRLVAYVVPDGEAPGEADLRAALARSLPAYMIPAAFVMLGAFPLGPNGNDDV